MPTESADTGGAETEPSPKARKDAEATVTKRPKSGRTASTEEDDDPKSDVRLGIALIGIGGMLVASLGGVAAILIHRRRINSKKYRNR